jgi:glyoxylase-like metal-dependent hydrolase (beta-lactamase superfamily II)
MGFSRRDVIKGGALALAAGVIGQGVPAWAQGSAASAGFAALKAGGADVIAISDGQLALKLAVYADAPIEEATKLLAQAQATPDNIPTALNTYIVRVGGKTVLIDAGHDSAKAPTAGKSLMHLKAAGVDPAKVDVILLTHMHPDHVGALTSQGQANFPNATLMIAEPESKFWLDDAMATQAPEAMKGIFAAARAAVAPYAAAKKLELFSPGKEVVKGISSLATPGHTPGHTMYRIGSGKDALLVWGDLVHTPALQFVHPEWAISFDTDKAQAIATRKKIFDMVAADGLLVAGMHLPFTGVGMLKKAPQGYAFTAKV